MLELAKQRLSIFNLTFKMEFYVNHYFSLSGKYSCTYMKIIHFLQHSMLHKFSFRKHLNNLFFLWHDGLSNDWCFLNFPFWIRAKKDTNIPAAKSLKNFQKYQISFWKLVFRFCQVEDIVWFRMSCLIRQV